METAFLNLNTSYIFQCETEIVWENIAKRFDTSKPTQKYRWMLILAIFHWKLLEKS